MSTGIEEHGFETGDMILDCHSPRVDVVDYIDHDGDPVTRLATPTEALKARILSDPDWRAWFKKPADNPRPTANSTTFEATVYYDEDEQCVCLLEDLDGYGFESGDRVKVTLEKINA